MSRFVGNHFSLYHKVKISSYDLNFSQEELNEFADEALRLGDVQNKKTNVKADMSYWFLWEHTSVYNKLLNQIVDLVNNDVPWMLKDFKKDFSKFIISTAWVASYGKGDYTLSHNHGPEAWASFVFFIKGTEEDSPLVFDTQPPHLELPIPNKLMIFPSQIFHRVPESLSENKRIVLAGNIVYRQVENDE